MEYVYHTRSTARQNSRFSEASWNDRLEVLIATKGYIYALQDFQ